MPIHILDKKVVALIAAGEVVERPASVVKELVENALDAGSSQIAVEVRGGGISLIRVTDNGDGIASAEAELAFERYATSKISHIDDLQSLRSLGFRGEALPSIAAVAEVEMVTCAAGSTEGIYLSLEGGVVTNKKAHARPPGTTITVRNLFRKIPARLKFLKSTATENSHIANVVSQYALAYPEVAFRLDIDGREALLTAGKGSLMDSVVAVYGLEVARNMVEIKDAADWSPVRVTGMVGAPAISRAGRDGISFFINRRWVNSRLLVWAVEEAYHGLLMTGKHPVAIINIDVPAGEVDVNIHPAKSEVKFQNEPRVFVAVQKAVRQALVAQMPVPAIAEVSTAYRPPSTGHPQSLWKAMPPLANTPTHPAPTLAATLPALRVIGQAMASYIVAEGPDGLYLIDQHAAHERILFERVREQRGQRAIEVQGLLEPATFEVNPREEEVLKSHLAELVDLGFALEPFGNRTYLVRTVPAMVGKGDWSGVLREVLDGAEARTDWSERVAISLACHGAVRAGQSLSDDEMLALVRQLEKTSSPHTCPHGRPTLIHLSAGQLSKEFGR